MQRESRMHDRSICLHTILGVAVVCLVSLVSLSVAAEDGEAEALALRVELRRGSEVVSNQTVGTVPGEAIRVETTMNDREGEVDQRLVLEATPEQADGEFEALEATLKVFEGETLDRTTRFTREIEWSQTIKLDFVVGKQLYDLRLTPIRPEGGD